MSKSDKISEAIGRRGLMLVLSSPSGAGKTSIARRLLDEDNNLTLSVSATTRPPRANEEDGRDYHFVDQQRFDQMVAQDEFLEYATVFSNSYGTPKADVMSALERGEDVLFDIDWQGTQQVANAARTDLVSVFILPPSREALQQRLISRAQDSADVWRTMAEHRTRSAITANMIVSASLWFSSYRLTPSAPSCRRNGCAATVRSA